jgi:hypothetical protein
MTNRGSLVDGVRKLTKSRNYSLPSWGQITWCDPNSQYVSPHYEYICDPNDKVNMIRLQGSTPSALRTMVLGAILSFEQNRCFFIDDPVRMTKDYFEPIGLPRFHPIVTKAIAEDRVHVMTPQEYWNNRIPLSTVTSLLDLQNVDGQFLRKVMLRRILKLKWDVKDDICDNLDQFDFRDEFMTLSVKQHRTFYDKEVRGEVPENLESHRYGLDQYIHHAKDAFRFFFNDTALPIYVATDDCRVMSELRALEPTWSFYSECDYLPDGFVFSPFDLWHNSELTESERNAYMHKIFVDLWAMAVSTYFIGAGATDMAWIAYFMRGSRNHFILVDKAHTMGRYESPFDYW